MTVGELKKELEKYPDYLEVLVNGYEGGFTQLHPKNISQNLMVENYYSSAHYGPYEFVESLYGEDLEGKLTRSCLILPR